MIPQAESSHNVVRRRQRFNSNGSMDSNGTQRHSIM